MNNVILRRGGYQLKGNLGVSGRGEGKGGEASTTPEYRRLNLQPSVGAGKLESGKISGDGSSCLTTS